MTFSKITENTANRFRRGLYSWTAGHPREMPWKGVKDPYKVWLSEIILQQTRVEQGMPYFNRFIKRFPDVYALAKSSIKQVLKQWEGLGYYSRARNLHTTAQWIIRSRDGRFPDDYPSILELKGVGPYTAAAIASFAFDLPHAVLDGNVHRVLSRYFGIEQTMEARAGKKIFETLADRLLDRKNPALFNQAIMDFGALCCTPKNPDCGSCHLNKHCIAFKDGRIDRLPPSKKNKPKRIRHFHYFVMLDPSGQVVLTRRPAGDVWPGLYEFPKMETGGPQVPKVRLPGLDLPPRVKTGKPVLMDKQILSHQVVHGYFYLVRIPGPIKNQITSPVNKLNQFPMPGILARSRKFWMELLM